MQVQNVGSLSLGQWMAICRGWNKAHGSTRTAPPTEDEFDRAVMQARGIS
jgi:hypothetical protein